jgi:formylglycine-generating enzyme required for sulfatase activity
MAEGAAEVALRIDALTFELVRIPPGELDLGSPDAEEGHQRNESPVRRVRITRPFYLGRFPVTQRQYVTLMGHNPSSFHGDELAMDQVTHPSALELCEEIERRTGVHVVLPTEAQWEYACRAGTTTRFYTGDTDADLARAGWYADNSGGTVHPVGLKVPNGFGLYDMHGNVFELCAGFLGRYARIRAEDPVGPLAGRCAMRGGGYGHGTEYARSASRLLSNVMFGGAGVRLAASPPAPTEP